MPYQNLKSFQNAEIIHDFTVEFCEKYIKPRHKTDRSYRSYRTADQMEQAARSGKQNIVEGTSFSRTSKKSEIKLVGVARGSLEELKQDYIDFLRQRGLPVWDKDSIEAQEVRKLVYKSDKSYRTYKSYMSSPERAANAMICLINQTTYLLDRQIAVLEKQFIEQGGYTENLFKSRLTYRTTHKSYKS